VGRASRDPRLALRPGLLACRVPRTAAQRRRPLQQPGSTATLFSSQEVVVLLFQSSSRGARAGTFVLLRILSFFLSGLPV
jgi:hypothetical protein